MKSNFVRTLTVISILLGFTSPARAIIVGGGITGGDSSAQGGSFIELSDSNNFSIGDDTFQDPNLYAFNEGQNIVINTPLQFNVGTTPSPLPVGTEVASHYVFFDPDEPTTVQGFVEFDSSVLA